MEIMNLFKGKTNSFENLVGIEIIQTGEKSASCIQMTSNKVWSVCSCKLRIIVSSRDSSVF